jgi:hypothetical protein
MAQTFQLDLSSILRSTPQGSGRSASFGLGLAPGVTGFDFILLNGLPAGEAASGVVAKFKIDQGGPLYTLFDSCDGRFALAMAGEDALIDEDGYASLLAHDVTADPALTEYRVTIRCSAGASYRDYVVEIPIDQP